MNDNFSVNEILNDLIYALKNSNEANDLYYLEMDDLFVEGNIYDYCISYKVTQIPEYTCTRSANYWPVDLASEDEYEKTQNLEFKITEIIAFKDGDDVCDVLSMLNKEQYETVKSYMSFDDESIIEKYREKLYRMRHENDDFLSEAKKIQITEQDILYMVKCAINEVASKRTAMNRIYKVTHDITSHLYHDENWHGVTLVVDAIESIGYECEVSVKDGGYRENDGARWKEYCLTITTPEGFEIHGTLNCHAAGTVEDPFDRYDMSLVMW